METLLRHNFVVPTAPWAMAMQLFFPPKEQNFSVAVNEAKNCWFLKCPVLRGTAVRIC